MSAKQPPPTVGKCLGKHCKQARKPFTLERAPRLLRGDNTLHSCELAAAVATNVVRPPVARHARDPDFWPPCPAAQPCTCHGKFCVGVFRKTREVRQGDELRGMRRGFANGSDGEWFETKPVILND